MTTNDLVTRNAEAKKKYLDLYYEWMQNGLPNDGLCNCLGYFRGENTLFDLMRPQNDELDTTSNQGYWGMDGLLEDERSGHEFGTLRQNIVLFLAAMNNEL